MKLPHYVILALLLVIGAMWFFWPQPKDPDYSEYEFKIKLRDAQIHSLGRDYEKLVMKIESDSVSHTNEIQTYKDRDKKKSAYIANLKANPIVIKVREEVPLIDSAFHAYDSLLQSKDEQIELQARYIDTLQVDIGKVTDNFMERLKLQSETIDDQKLIIDGQRKELRQERRGKRLAKFVAIGAAIGGFLLGSQL